MRSPYVFIPGKPSRDTQTRALQASVTLCPRVTGRTIHGARRGDGVIAAVAATALPATVAATWLLLLSPAARRLVAAPRGDRWHVSATPLLGGVGIFAGFAVGLAAAIAAGASPASRQLLGIAGG